MADSNIALSMELTNLKAQSKLVMIEANRMNQSKIAVKVSYQRHLDGKATFKGNSLGMANYRTVQQLNSASEDWELLDVWT